MRIKIEMNTFERSLARPAVTRSLAVDSPWFSGTAEVASLALEELIATKIRALFQRSKGRDLFDLWVAVTHAGIRPSDIAECFAPYRPSGWTITRAAQNMEAKLPTRDFTSDIEQLVANWPEGYSIQRAAQVANAVLNSIDAIDAIDNGP